MSGEQGTTMSDARRTRSPELEETTACTRPWCVTRHGETAHPDDEDHRSAGLGVTVEARSGGEAGRGQRTIVEVGLLQRRADPSAWVVIEDGDGVHVEVTLDSARRLVRAIAADPLLRAALTA